MIKFNNVTFSYASREVLKDFSLSIEEGERICLFAPSGYGKTTLLRLIMGLEQSDKGEITGLDGKKISVAFQEDRLLPHKTVKENITLFGDSHGADEILEKIGLSSAATMYPSQCSGGMARRAAIARAINRDADIYILDEPFNGIDKENIALTAEAIMSATRGKTFIMVSHDTAEAELLDAKVIDISGIQ